jgi:hypothetical protein
MPAVADAHASTAPAERTACVDPAAMAANANLVGQIHDYDRRLVLAAERAKDAEANAHTLREVTSAPPGRLGTSRDEWERMAQKKTLRLRLPCTSWDSGSGFSFHRAQRGARMRVRFGTRSAEVRQRASAAGFSPEELETLGDVYRRVHAQTWASIRASCEGNDTFRENVALLEEPTDESRVATCRAAMLDVNDDTGRAALAGVTELRAAARGIERAAGDEQRVAFVLTSTPTVLFDEMARAFGRERAVSAIDNGVVCLDETLYDLHDPQDASK